jgi:Flp pilus assembly protein TadG
MRRLSTNPEARDESGATIILFALVLFSLLAISAFVVDVGALVQERRTLQNGADAAALAVAKDCATTGCGPYASTAKSFADANADDGVSTPREVCGTSPLPGCASPPSVPAGAGYVRVETETLSTGGSNQVPFSFAKVMGFTGATVTRQATVAWGGPAGLTSSLPLTFSECEFKAYTANGTQYAVPGPPYPAWPTNVAEQIIYFHSKDGMPSECPSSGSGADLPGGFGWLQPTSGCKATSTADGWFDDKTGRPVPSSCPYAEMSALVGKVIHIPVFDLTNGLNGTNGQYRIKGFAAFYMTGYSINGPDKVKSLKTNTFPCGGSDSCISGYFVNGQLAAGGGVVGGPSMGVVVVQVIG